MNPFDAEDCPHCDEPQPSQQVDAHVATAHADLPPCRAFIETEHRETYRCAFRAGHAKGKYGEWHASTREASPGRYVWNDSALGATPHRDPEPRVVGLDHFKAMGAVSHTVVATGDDSDADEQTCAESHTGPCFPLPLAACEAHDRLECSDCHRNAEQCGQRNHVACGYWVRGMHDAACPNRRVEPTSDEGRPEPPTEAELNDALPVRPDPRQPAYDAVYEYIRKLDGYLPPDPVHRNAVIWRAVHAALGATPVGRCVSSHCVEGGHIVLADGEWEAP